MSRGALRLGVTAIVIGGLSLLAWVAGPSQDSAGNDVLWYSILPPLLAIALAVATNRIVVSLGAAVVLGGLLTTLPDAPLSVEAWAVGIDTGFGFIGDSLSDRFNQKLLIFITLVLAMIAIIVYAGGLHGVVQWLSRFAKGPRSAQFVTWLMGLAVFIDDYANTMIVGTAMRPVTDRFRISREKLAFLVDSTSAPVAGLAVVSTWVGYEVGLFNGQVEELNLDTTGYAMLFDALPSRYYCIFMIAFVALTIIFGRDFGPMRAAERRARATGKVADDDAMPMTSETFSTAEPVADATIKARNAVIPIGFLFATLLAGIWIDGGGLEALSADALAFVKLSAWREIISESENSVKILAYAAGGSILVAAACAKHWAGVSNNIIREAILSGARSSLLPIAILTLAWSIKGACDALGTAEFLVAWVGESVPPPAFASAIFLVALVTAFATGTSYGTMGILIPIATPIAYHLDGGTYGLVTVLTLASILDGSIVGDHCSPISDTTIMSSISSSCDHVHHVRTQLPYSLSVAAIALVCGYIPSGFGLPPVASYGLAAVALVGLVLIAGHSADEPAAEPAAAEA